VIGYDLETPEDFRNEATVLSPNGDFPGIYDKVHPTVFGGEPYGINAGTFPVYETPLGTLGTLICFDMDFTDAARKLAIQGAEFIAVPSLDFPDIAKVHYTQMALRAVENRTAMVTAVVDPNGRLIDWRVVPNGGEAILVADVPLGTGPTLYTRLGDWVGWLSLAGPALLIVPTPIIRQNAE
jgi:apolipoprotein N-acyltransferase